MRAVSLTIAVAAFAAWQGGTPRPPVPTRLAVACLYKREQETNKNKICFYDCAGGETAITIGAGRACPLSIKRAPFGLPTYRHFSGEWKRPDSQICVPGKGSRA